MDTLQESNYGTLSLDAEPEFGNISLNSPDIAPAVPSELAHLKATKAHFGLGAVSPGFNSLYEGIANGQELELRLNSAIAHSSNLRQEKYAALANMAQEPNPNMEHAKVLLDWQPNVNPNTVFEKTYAQKYISSVAGNDSATTMAALSQNVEQAHQVMDIAQDTVTKQELFKTIIEEAHTYFNNQGLGAKTADYISSFIPGLSAIAKHNIIAQTSSFLPGNNTDEQFLYVWSRPPEEAAALVRTAVKKLQENNPLLAIQFAEAMLGQTMAHHMNANVGAALDATILATPMYGLTKKMLGAVTANTAKVPNVSKILEATGDIEKAADVKATEIISARQQQPVMPVIDKGFDPLGQKLDLTTTLPTYNNPKTIAIGPNIGTLSRERANRTVGMLEQGIKDIEDVSANTTRVSVLTGPDLQIGLALTREKLLTQYKHLNDGIMDVRVTPGNPNVLPKEAELAATPGIKLIGQNKDGFNLYERSDGRRIYVNEKGYTVNETPSMFKGPNLASGGRRDEFEITSNNSRLPGFEHIPAEQTRTNVDYVKMNVGKTQYEKASSDLGFPLGPIKESSSTKAVWRNKDTDLPIEIIPEAPSKGPDGRMYQKVKYDGKESYVPADEIVHPKTPEFVTAKEAKQQWGETIIGTREALPFKTANQADNYAQNEFRLHIGEYSTVQGTGGEWYISIVKPVDVTDKTLRALTLETRNTNNTSAVQAALGHYLTPANQVSQFVRDQRLIATTAPTNVFNTVKNLLEPVKGSYLGSPGISKYSKERLNNVLEYYRDYLDYSKPQMRGTFPVSMIQLQKDWKKVTGHQPTPREQDAFWRMVQINDYDWTLRNYNLHRNLARRDVEHVSWPHPTKEGMRTDPVMAKVIKKEDFPWTTDRDHVLSIYKDGEWTHVSKNRNNYVNSEEFKAWLERPSVTISQLANPEDRPLKGVFERNPHYVISEDVQRGPLPINLVDYNGGGHVFYPGEWYTKQAIVEAGPGGQLYHYGDQTIFNFNSKAQAKFYTGKIDDFRKMLLEGKNDVELSSFIEKNLPKDLDFWKQKFEGPNAILNKEHPITIAERNSNTIKTDVEVKKFFHEKYGENIISYEDDSLMFGIDKSSLQDRNGPLMSIESRHWNPKTPVYELVPARVLHPLDAMDRGIRQAVKGLYMDDAKAATIEQFIKQYKDNINMKYEDIARNPYHAFYHGELIGDANVVASAERAKINMKNFLRTTSDMQGEINNAEENLLQSIFNIAGDRPVNYYAIQDWHAIKHPVDFLRNSVSNIRLGMFNPRQLVVQAAGATHALAISPLHGLQGAAASLLHHFQFLADGHLAEGVSKGVLATLDKMAILGGWKSGRFAESVNLAERSGFLNIAKTAAIRDSIKEEGLFQGKVGNFFDKGYGFFNGGERFSRTVAWHTTVHEWRASNPTKNITDRDVGEMINRATLMNGDMLREANSAFQKGWGGIPSQFQSFRMRVAEQMMGGRITQAQAVRAQVVAASLWGIPVAVSAYGLGKLVPGGMENLYDDVRQYLIRNQINLDDSKVIKFFQDGAIDNLTTWVTGKNYSVSKNLGPGVDNPSLTDVKDIFTDPMSVLKDFMGPIPSLIANAGTNLYTALAGTYTADGQRQFQVTHDEILDTAREISSVNNIYNAWMAWNYQKAISRNHQVLVDPSDPRSPIPPMSKTDAVMALFGVNRQDVTDVREMQAILKDQKNKEEFIKKMATKPLKDALEAAAKGDWKTYDNKIAKAQTLLTYFGDINETEQRKLKDQVIKESGSVATQVQDKFYDINKMPQSEIPLRIKKLFGIEMR